MGFKWVCRVDGVCRAFGGFRVRIGLVRFRGVRMFTVFVGQGFRV